MATLSPPSLAESLKFEELAFKLLPRNIPWRHRGRGLCGMDCAGLVFWVYKHVGVNLSHLDLPYTEKDTHDPEFFYRIIDRMENQFRDVTALVRCGCGEDGDILILRDRNGEPHFGLLHGPMVYEMRARLIRTRMEFAAGRIFKAYRMKDVKHG